MNRLRALRYLGGALAASGGGLGSSGVPAACKERGSNGRDKQQQQQQQQQQPGFLGDWLQKPPAAIGNAAAARWRMRNLLTSLQVRLHLLDLPVSFDEATKKDSVGGQMKEEKREPTTATATTATEAAEAAAAAAAESGKGLQNKKRLRVVVVGGGWSSSSFVSSLDPRQFEVVWISPEEHLSYTPLLPCVCGGALPAAACTTSLRGLLSFGGKAEGRGRYYQAVVDNVDLNNNRVVCRPVLSLAETSSSGERGSWEEAYDYLILGVGSEVNTFNIPGVQQHALFLKTAADAERIRGRLKCCLEAAASANISEKERQELLTFVIVGAGPSGVEAAAEIQDFLNTTGARVYPQLQQYFKVVLLEMGSVPLPMYNTQVQQSLGNTFSKSGVDLRLNARVVAVGPSHVQVRRMQPAAAAAVTAAVRDTLTATRGGGASKDSSAAAGGGTSAGGAAAGAAAAAATSPAPATTTTAAAAAATDECIPTRFVLWASGVRPTSLALSVAKGLKQQVRPQRLLVSPNLQVLGTNNVFALGDCCCIQPPPLQVYAQQLFNLAKKGDSHKGAGKNEIIIIIIIIKIIIIIIIYIIALNAVILKI